MIGTIVTVVGARPQFVKAAPLGRALRESFREVLVHTGQHYDREMSESFFRELDIPEPDVNLEVGSLPHGRQTARMRVGILEVVERERPFAVVTYGDTNSTLAGALAARDAGSALAHVEAGLRSFRPAMPEETNRIVTDHLSDLCLCPTPTAVENLRREGIGARASLVGDVMLDACREGSARTDDEALLRHGVRRGEYAFATIHRAENVEHPSRLGSILRGLSRVDLPILFAVHPRTREAIARFGLTLPGNVLAIPPASHLEALALVRGAARVYTDSGGLQKEAFFLGTACVTLREETEWTETVRAGWNVLAGADEDAIASAVSGGSPEERDLDVYGAGNACARIRDALAEFVRMSN